MTQKRSKINTTFLSKHKDILVISGTLLALSTAAIGYYYYRKKKQTKIQNDGDAINYQTPPFVGANGLPKSINSNKNYPIGLGSRHPDVTILQRYLKIYKENLGRSGPKGDGVDGIFGQSTLQAAKKRLQKTVFTKADILGMRKALKSLGKL